MLRYYVAASAIVVVAILILLALPRPNPDVPKGSQYHEPVWWKASPG